MPPETRKYGETDGDLLLCPEAEVVLGKAVRWCWPTEACAIPTNHARLTRARGLATERLDGAKGTAAPRSRFPTLCLCTTGVLERRDVGRPGCCSRPDPSVCASARHDCSCPCAACARVIAMASCTVPPCGLGPAGQRAAGCGWVGGSFDCGARCGFSPRAANLGPVCGGSATKAEAADSWPRSSMVSASMLTFTTNSWPLPSERRGTLTSIGPGPENVDTSRRLPLLFLSTSPLTKNCASFQNGPRDRGSVATPTAQACSCPSPKTAPPTSKNGCPPANVHARTR